jgi:hypothetical protein
MDRPVEVPPEVFEAIRNAVEKMSINTTLREEDFNQAKLSAEIGDKATRTLRQIHRIVCQATEYGPLPIPSAITRIKELCETWEEGI